MILFKEKLCRESRYYFFDKHFANFPMFHFDANPDPDQDASPNFTPVGKSEFFSLIFTAVPVHPLYIDYSFSSVSQDSKLSYSDSTAY